MLASRCRRYGRAIKPTGGDVDDSWQRRLFNGSDDSGDDSGGGSVLNKIEGNPGNGLLIGTASADKIEGAAGNDTIRGRGGNDVLDGQSGNEGLFGGAGNDDLEGAAGRDILRGGGGRDVLDGGRDHDVLIGGGGPDIFEFERGYDNDVVRDFQDRIDQVDLTDTQFSYAAETLAFAQQVGTDIVFDFGCGDTLTLEDTNLASLGNADFIL